MDHETKAWCAFCAAVFLWMGVSLLLGAPDYAGSALDWMAGGEKSSLATRRRLTFLYRCFGAAWGAFGLWLFWKTSSDSSFLAAHLHRQRLGRVGRSAAGALLFLGGSLLAAVKAAAALRRGRSLSLEVELELGSAPEAWREKAGRAWGWVIAAAFLAFGAYLLRGAAI
jgi:hypothetical protein